MKNKPNDVFFFAWFWEFCFSLFLPWKWRVTWIFFFLKRKCTTEVAYNRSSRENPKYNKRKKQILRLPPLLHRTLSISLFVFLRLPKNPALNYSVYSLNLQQWSSSLPLLHRHSRLPPLLYRRRPRPPSPELWRLYSLQKHPCPWGAQSRLNGNEFRSRF